MTPEELQATQTRTIRNATIQGTKLGVDHTDHGILSFWITLDFGGEVQNWGGRVLDTVNPVYLEGHHTAPIRVPTKLAASLVLGIYALLGKDWEDLRGLPVRACSDKSEITALGHYLKDQWLWYNGSEYCVTPLAEVLPV